MKKFISIILIFFYFTILYPVNAAISTQSSTISKIENDIYGYDYPKDSAKSRVERLERTVYGKVNTGDINKRLTKLSGDISADVIGLEIDPVEDTFAYDDDVTADSSVNYPIVDEIEKKLFNETYKNRDFHTRIVTIEKKLFGKVYDVDDYATRMDRIKAEIMPETVGYTDRFAHEYRDNRNNMLTTDDLNGRSSLSRFAMPFGQRKYSRPYANYGDEYTDGASTVPNYNTNLNDELAQLEYETFGTVFSNEDTVSRVKRLNSISKAKKSSQRYDSNKFTQRMSTAIEIGAMILMILAMVL